jgi:hypothetical protein
MTGHLKSKPGYECKSWLERIVILGYEGRKSPSSVTIVTPMTGEVELKAELDQQNRKLLTIRKPGVNICADWELTIKP